MSKEVTCIKKDDKNHERISEIGGRNWSMSEDDAIKAIEAKTESFYVNVKGHRADIVVAKNESRKYLKTTADDDKTNNLLSLTECP